MKQVFNEEILDEVVADALTEFSDYAADEESAIKFAIKFLKKVLIDGYTVTRVGDDNRAYNITVKFSLESLKHYMGSECWNDVKRRGKATLFASAVMIAIVIASEGIIMCNPYPIKSMALFGAIGTGIVCGSLAYDYVYKTIYHDEKIKEVYGYDKRTEQTS